MNILSKKIFSAFIPFCLLLFACLRALSDFTATESLDNSISKNPLGHEALTQALIDSTRKDFLSPESVKIGKTLFQLDKRNELARSVTAFNMAREGSHAEFLKTFTPIITTDSKNIGNYMSSLIALCADAEFKLKLSQWIEQNKPTWGALFLRTAFEAKTFTDDEMVHLFSLYPAEQKRLVRYFLTHKQWDKAYQVFKMTRDLEHTSDQEAIYNPRFKPSNAALPFNWNYNKTHVDNTGDGVSMNFSGRKQSVFLQQTFPITAGTHIFESEYRGKTYTDAATLTWQISCAQKNEKFAVGALKGSNSGKKKFSLKFDVADDSCGFAIATLMMRPGVFTRETEVQIFSATLKSGSNK